MPTFKVWTPRGPRYVKVKNAKEGALALRRIAIQTFYSFDTTRPAFVEMIDNLNWQEMF
jgi:hypothetical protein